MVALGLGFKWVLGGLGSGLLGWVFICFGFRIWFKKGLMVKGSVGLKKSYKDQY